MEIKWTSAMSVGEETIDKQHQGLVDQINKLIHAFENSKTGLGLLRETNHFLYVYFKEHFAYEEQYMAKHNFSGLEKHKKMHQKFIKFYENFQKELKEKLFSKNFTLIEVEELLKKIKKYLADWLITHIKTVDQQYAKYIKKHPKLA